jgi:membrane-associated phospholipid phosphatase
MLPLVACMCVSTIWGRYHYVADIFGGMITGTLGYVIGSWLVERRLPAEESTAGTAQTEVWATHFSG